MPTTDALQKAIYDFESAIEFAIGAVCAAEGIVTYSAANDAITDEWREANPALTDYLPTPVENQKQRPRIELTFSAGSGHGTLYPISGRKPVSGSMPETSYGGTLDILVVTEPSTLTHRTFLARLRAIMDRIREDVNETANLPRHSVQMVAPRGTSPTMKADDGAFTSQLQYEVEFCIRTDAFSELFAD